MAVARWALSGGTTRSRPSVLTLAAVPVALLGAIPIWFILDSAVDSGWSGIRPLVFRRRVAELVQNTLELSVLTMAVTVLLGVSLAWLVERTDLPLRRIAIALLVAPLAVPAFVNAYAWSSLRPSIDGLGGALLILSLSYFPFVLLPVAAALRGLDPALEETAAALGSSPVAVFFRVVMPQLRPAILGGALLVGLHVLAEFGALQMLRYQTFTTVILVQYKSSFNSSAGTMLAAVLVLCCLVLVTVEVLARGRTRYARVGVGAARRHSSVRLGFAGVPSGVFVVAVIALSLGAPAYAMMRWLGHDGAVWSADLTAAMSSTLKLAGLGALVTTGAAWPIAWLAVRRRNVFTTMLERSAYLTSALPGVVVALALITVSIRYVESIYQSTLLVVVAYVMLFLPRALVNLRTGIGQAPPELDDASRALGASPVRTFARVTLPLTAPGVASAAAFVFLAVCTELTATLLLAPTGTTTLATGFWNLASELDYAAAAPFAAVMVLLSAPMTYLMLQQSRRVRNA